MSPVIDESGALIALTNAYFQAMLDADEAALRRIFDPRASIIGHEGGAYDFASLDEFIATTPDARTGDRPFDCRIEGLTTVGDIAVVTVGNYCYGEWFTDHLSMMKVDGSWRIVAKTYYIHPDG